MPIPKEFRSVIDWVVSPSIRSPLPHRAPPLTGEEETTVRQLNRFGALLNISQGQESWHLPRHRESHDQRQSSIKKQCHCESRNNVIHCYRRAVVTPLLLLLPTSREN